MFSRFFDGPQVGLRWRRLDGPMPLLSLIAALGLLAAVALAAVTVLTFVLFGLSRLEMATVPVRRRP